MHYIQFLYQIIISFSVLSAGKKPNPVGRTRAICMILSIQTTGLVEKIPRTNGLDYNPTSGKK